MLKNYAAGVSKRVFCLFLKTLDSKKGVINLIKNARYVVESIDPVELAKSKL
ncbi:MAG: hypothetical protein AAF620_02940 [Bacteroidota bacterium]